MPCQTIRPSRKYRATSSEPLLCQLLTQSLSRTTAIPMARTVSASRRIAMNRKQPSTPVWVIVAIVAGGMALLTAGVVIVGVVLFTSVSPQPANVTPVTAKKIYERDELDKLLKGKTEKEVLELLGKPESTSMDRDGDTTWVYEGISRDRITNKIDTFMFVNISKGVVKGSHY